MKVKICGLKTVEAALHAAHEGADALGFVFARSKRQIYAEQAREIIQELPEGIWKVGVFVNETPEKIAEIAEIAGLTHIQLHGEEETSLYRKQGKEVIKSVSIKTEEDIDRIRQIEADYILLDSPPGHYKGGNGTKFNWELAAGLEVRNRVILAGGLNPENVKTAIQTVHPFMVDVSSGVETEGEKDLAKISVFIREAKGTREDEK
ncbi:phosphoribosylanthranilate isomerase [Mesobacillus persicus]|uniref:N-(5'-phosphoribosyl)anthranilate isomerase n=1 Tax=Mesobacillus persicus TaxID=930146 RepID=A0A1H8HQA5_9BACI|nr:phosphoribosylanthranilate isomerase [Mesobacillus persicus]SEN58259.1 phosphoribosylanthranilate isomerase [Mesobacillus persicus]